MISTPQQPINPAQAFQRAIQLHQGGRFAEAEAIYRQIIAADPHNFAAQSQLGLLALQIGRADAAVELIQSALRIKPKKNRQNALDIDRNYAMAYSNLGNAFKELGRPEQAEAAYRKAIALVPDFVVPHCNLGIVLYSMGQAAKAETALRKAIALAPELVEAHNNLGNVLSDLGRPEKAEASFRKAIQLRPDYPMAHNNLGNVLKSLGRLEEAVEEFQQAIALKPDYPMASYNLGNTLALLQRLEEAETAYRKSIQLNPNFSEAHSNLGNVLRDLNRPDEAEAAYRQAFALKPNLADSHLDLSTALISLGRLEKGAEAIRCAIALEQGNAEAHTRLGNVLFRLGRFEEAEAEYRQTISLQPDSPMAYCALGNLMPHLERFNDAEAAFSQAITLGLATPELYTGLANILYFLGRREEAEALCRQAMAIKPDNAVAHSGLLSMLSYGATDEATIFLEHRKWDERHGTPLKSSIEPHTNSREPDRRLRIGFVSPDLGRHPVGYFLLPVLEHHDRRSFEIFCYSDRLTEDDLTAELQGHADAWRRNDGSSDSDLAGKIRQDGIDILVDLAGHTANNRLRVFAMKPAPVQMTWLGYWNTTGLETMDYIILDRKTSPAAMEPYYVEKPIYLPDTRFCYAPPSYAPEVAVLPAFAKGQPTFGSFNNTSKLSPEVIALWSEVLRAVPTGRLVLKGKTLGEEKERERLHRIFAEHGIDRERLELRGWSSHLDMLKEYGDMDIALDPFPFSGGLTSCEALWMGVPIITLPGDRPVSRQTYSFLSLLGLDECVAADKSSYVAIAQGLAGNLGHLANIRRSLRERMAHSPLCDGQRFTRNFESELRNAWRTWCKQPGESIGRVFSVLPPAF